MTTTPVTFFVIAAEVARLLPPEISVPVQSCLLGGSGMVPHQVFLYSLEVLFPHSFSSSQLLSIPAPEASNQSSSSLTSDPEASVVVYIVNVFITL